MNSYLPIKYLWPLMFCLSLVFINGCVKIRLLTYPSSFKWIAGAELDKNMQDMAYSLGKIDLMIEEEVSPGSNNSEILLELQKLESIATSLSPAGTGISQGTVVEPTSNHALLDTNIDRFIEQILRARLQAEKVPPDYYGIGQLTGGCISCHQLR